MLDARKVTAGAAGLLVAHLVVRAWLVARGDFYWDDLILIGQATDHNILGWDYLGQSHDGHLMPGAYLVAGVSTLIAPVQWWLPAVTLVVLQAIASLAVWRAIRIIAPDARGGALAAFAFYLFVPMTVTAYVWWAAGLNTLPFQAALAYVVGNAVLLVRDQPTGRRRTRLIVGASVAFMVGLLFFEKSLLIAPVAFIVTVLAVRRRAADPDDYRSSPLTVAFLRARHLWAVLGAVFVGWGVLFAATTTFGEGRHSTSQTVHLVWRSINDAIVPSLAGGPWVWERWVPSPPMGFPPVWMIVVGWLILAALVIGTVRARRGAVAVWLFVAVYAVGAQIPVMWSRSSENTALELAQTMRYLPDTALILTLGFAVIAAAPSAAGAHAAAKEPDRRLSAAGAAACVVLAISAMISTAAFSQAWRDDPTGDYLANAKQALADNADGVMFDQSVPLEVLLPVAYPNNQISRIFGRLRERPDFGTHTDRLVVLDPNGNASPGAVTKARTIEAGRGTCADPEVDGPRRLELDGPLIDVQWTIQLSYCADRDGEIDLRLDGGQPVRVPVTAGLHSVYVQLSGHGTGVQIRPVTPGLALHTGEGRVGLPVLAGLAP